MLVVDKHIVAAVDKHIVAAVEDKGIDIVEVVGEDYILVLQVLPALQLVVDYKQVYIQFSLLQEYILEALQVLPQIYVLDF